jgi:hypothetical protein
MSDRCTLGESCVFDTECPFYAGGCREQAPTPGISDLLADSGIDIEGWQPREVIHQEGV